MKLDFVVVTNKRKTFSKQNNLLRINSPSLSTFCGLGILSSPIAKTTATTNSKTARFLRFSDNNKKPTANHKMAVVTFCAQRVALELTARKRRKKYFCKILPECRGSFFFEDGFFALETLYYRSVTKCVQLNMDTVRLERPLCYTHAA